MFAVELKSKRMIIGIVLAVIAVVVCEVWASGKIGLLFALVLLAEGAVKVRPPKMVTLIIYVLWGLGCLAFLCLMNPLTGPFKGEFGMLVLNYLCVLVVALVVFVISSNWKVSVDVSVGLLAVLAMANMFIYQFRGKELSAVDLLSIGTAMNVADQYTVQVTTRLVYYWVVLAVGIFFQSMLPPFPTFQKVPKLYLRIGGAVALLVTAITVGCASADISVITWGHKGSRVNGYYLNFYIGLRDSRVDKPEGYSPEVVRQHSAAAPTQAPSREKEDMPNIIVIMDEAYSDLRVFGGELKTNVPVTPFIDSLSENTVKGYALCSVLGGNTANSEFEMLTSHSMAFLPTGTVPYQQYLSNKTYSLAWLLQSYGYDTMATHPYLSSGWSRTTAFPNLGFQEYSFQEAYPHEHLVREYVSDQEMFEYVLEQLGKDEDDAPKFLFCITMQNHGGYTYEGENYEKTIQLEGYSKRYPRAEQYLSLIHETDKAVEHLITSLKDYPEDTIVLFFGDHLPAIEQGLYNKLNGSELDTLEEQMLQHSVPFFIWANFDIQEDYIDCTSLNYLAGHLLEHAGLGKTSYYSLLSQIEETIPAINANGYYSAQKGCFLPLDQAQGAEAEAMELYAMVQYNDLFDPKNRDEALFGKYIDP